MLCRVWIAALLLCALPAAYADRSATEWLQEANTALTSSQYAVALHAFDEAIALEPSALTFYRRASAQQALGRTSAATSDLKEALERQPTLVRAYVQLVRLYLKDGEYASAQDILKRLDKKGGKLSDKDAAQVAALRTDVAHAQKLQKALAQRATPDACVQTADELLRLAPNDLRTRRQRAECEAQRGDLDAAVSDWAKVARLAPSPDLQRRLAVLSFYVLGTHNSQLRETGLAHLKACLHSDPDNAPCRRAHKQMRRVAKALDKAHTFADQASWVAVVSALKGPKVGGPTIYDEVKQLVADEHAAHAITPTFDIEKCGVLQEIDELYCRAYIEQDLVKKAMPMCERLLARDPDSVPGLVAQGELHMSRGEWDDALRAFSRAFDLTQRSDRKVHARLTKAHQKIKQAKAKDYYKVLGVARDADDRTIKKAYRRLAREHHPDKGGSQDKMAEINEAFGVLGDAELRARYDQGDDPNDPTGGAGDQPYAQPFGQPFAQGHPFAQFFQQAQFQQGGGGQTFHFSF